MNVTSKSRYAFKVMIDLASRPAGVRTDRADIAVRHGIPPTYLDQIILRLKKAGLIESHRGRMGGFFLTRSPAQITALDIVEAVENDTAPVVCLEPGQHCTKAEACISRSGWSLVFSAMRNSIQGISLANLASAEKVVPQFEMPTGEPQ